MFQGFWRRHTKLANLRFNAVKDIIHDAAAKVTDLTEHKPPEAPKPPEAKKDEAPKAPEAKKDEPKKEETTEGTTPSAASPKSDP